MKKRLIALLLLLALLMPAARAEELPNDLIRDALLTTVSESGGTFNVAGWSVVGQQRQGRDWALYLAASVGQYGFMGGYCTVFSGWGGPCTVLLQQVNDHWMLRDVLEVEDYSELPNIMPDKIVRKFLNEEYTSIMPPMRAQIEEQLARLGREEPLGDYAQAGGELSGVMVIASNLLISLLSPWPLGCTVVEREEAGETVLYEKRWQPDGSDASPLRLTNGSTYDWGGVPGTVTFIKTRKADGQVLGTITAHATVEDLTICLRDEYGADTYVLPVRYDAEGFPCYGQPAVTREGRCRVNDEGLERAMRNLPGERQSEWQIEAQAQTGTAERFTLERDGSYRRLRHEVLGDGGWETDWVNDAFFGDFCDLLRMDYQPGVSETQYGRFNRVEDGSLRIYGGDEHPAVYVSLSRYDGEWRVDTYQNSHWGEHAILLEDALLVQGSDLSSDDRAMYVPRAIDRSAKSFNHQTLGDIRWELRDLTEEFELAKRQRFANAGLAADYGYIAGAEALYIALGEEATLPVYAAPDAAAPRAAGGKAAVSLKGPIAVLCREGDWLMVLYEITSGKHRTGWISVNGHPAVAKLAEYALPAQFERVSARVSRDTQLLDDPLGISGILCSLSKGASVTVLDRSAPLWYVEARALGKTWRGYVESSCVEE